MVAEEQWRMMVGLDYCLAEVQHKGRSNKMEAGEKPPPEIHILMPMLMVEGLHTPEQPEQILASAM